jgi:NADH:ubiquinone oxidoreductase subunit 6 (subunit J)
MAPFAVDFLKNYWLHFELTSVLLLAGLVAALAVIKVTRKSHG